MAEKISSKHYQKVAFWNEHIIATLMALIILGRTRNFKTKCIFPQCFAWIGMFKLPEIIWTSSFTKEARNLIHCAEGLLLKSKAGSKWVPQCLQLAHGKATSPLPVISLFAGIDVIFQFIENWPANCNFSLFSKFPTNYPKNKKMFKKTIYLFPKIRGIPRITIVFLTFWFTLKSGFRFSFEFSWFLSFMAPPGPIST